MKRHHHHMIWHLNRNPNNPHSPSRTYAALNLLCNRFPGPNSSILRPTLLNRKHKNHLQRLEALLSSFEVALPLLDLGAQLGLVCL